MSYSSNTLNIIKITKTYSDFSAAALTNDIEIYSLAAGERIMAVTIEPTIAFTGGTIVAYTISVGIANNLTKFATAFSVFGAGTISDNNNFSIESSSASTSIRAAAVSVGANLDAATQGSVNIYIETVQIL